MPQTALTSLSPATLLSRLPPHISLPTWRTTLLILLVATNLKSLPLAWHVRLLYRFFTSLTSASDVSRTLVSHSQSRTSSCSSTGTTKDKKSIHPIFEPVSIHTHTPLLEIDYNLHKSNSTYFSDLDESRTALVSRLLGPGLRAGSRRSRSDSALEARGIKGRVAVILGSVHCSFHREIGAYEGYEVRSRVLGWDRKWLVIGSWLVKRQRGGGKELLLASALSKYVVKKGRFTVSPEHCLRVAGWLPEKPEGEAEGDGDEEGSVVLVPSVVDTEVQGTPVGDSAKGEDEGQAESNVEAAVEKLAEVQIGEGGDAVEGKEEELQAKVTEAADGPLEETGSWDWERIERERLRGLKIAEGWLALDTALKEEFVGRG